MIYLFTGNMGTGKTSRVVAMILDNEDNLFKMTLEDGTEVDRPLYFCHVDGLNAKKFKAHELTEEQIQAAPLRDVIPQGAVLIVDEAHYTYPVRAAARGVPPYIQELTELRHHGHTVILITQHPSQLDIFVRNLVSKHTHIERKAIGLKQYSWYKCVTSLDNPAAVSGVESSGFKPPKKAFPYYKSSNQHKGMRQKIPKAVWALVLILGFIGWKGYGVYSSYQRGVNPEVVQTQEQSQQAESIPEMQVSNRAPSASMGGDLTATLFVPTLAEKPESKPLYNSVRQVKTYERIAACVGGGQSGCTCYSDQATPLAEVTDAMCREYVKHGIPFNPYKDDSQAVQTAYSQPADTHATSGGQVAVMGGKSPQSLMYDNHAQGRLN